MPEKLRLDQLGGDRGAIERDERSFAPSALLMNGPRDQLLARPGFAQNAHPRFACRHPPNLPHQVLHRFAAANQFVLAQAVPQFAILVLQARKPQGVLHRNQELVRGDRLFEKVERAELNRLDRHFDIGLTGNENNGRLHARRLQVLQQREPVLPRHDHVGKDHVKRFRAQQLQGSRGIVADSGLVSRQAEGARKRRERVRVVVHEKEMSFARHVAFRRTAHPAVLARACGGGAGVSFLGAAGRFGGRCGRSMRKVVPRPASLETEIVPPWSLTTDCTIAKPRPVP